MIRIRPFRAAFLLQAVQSFTFVPQYGHFTTSLRMPEREAPQEGPEQLDLFTDYEERERQRQAEKEMLQKEGYL